MIKWLLFTIAALSFWVSAQAAVIPECESLLWTHWMSRSEKAKSDATYLTNAHDALVTVFAPWFSGDRDQSAATFREMLKTMHRVAAIGPDGDRPYKNPGIDGRTEYVSSESFPGYLRDELYHLLSEDFRNLDEVDYLALAGQEKALIENHAEIFHKSLHADKWELQRGSQVTDIQSFLISTRFAGIAPPHGEDLVKQFRKFPHSTMPYDVWVERALLPLGLTPDSESFIEAPIEVVIDGVARVIKGRFRMLENGSVALPRWVTRISQLPELPRYRGGHDNLNTLHVHITPDPRNLPYYIELAGQIMDQIRELEVSPANRDRMLALLADYYQVMINAHPFVRVNQSIFMSQVNYILSIYGLKPIFHGNLDNLAYVFDSDVFREVFQRRVLLE